MEDTGSCKHGTPLRSVCDHCREECFLDIIGEGWKQLSEKVVDVIDTVSDVLVSEPATTRPESECIHNVPLNQFCTKCAGITVDDKEAASTNAPLLGWDWLMSTEKQENDQCKGLFYRYRTSAYTTKRGFATSQSITLLKRMSCAGCNSCIALLDTMEMETVDSRVFPIVLPDRIKDFDIINPYFVAVGPPDWETGYVEDWEVHANIITKGD